ncbi:UbiA family prenyltransferase [Methylomonas paludis]|nr:UbiA family prenyltransferase [Methylomonas paludis]
MKYKGLWYYAVLLVFLGWCVISFRADIAQIKLLPVVQAWDKVLLALALSLLNYLLRVMRWTAYLQRLGHGLTFRFSALTYLAGFAFTLSPGKVGEMVRGRYLQKSGVPLTSTAAAFFVERLLDLLAMIALATLAVAYSSYQSLIWGAVAVIIVIMALLTIAPWSAIMQRLEAQSWLPVFFRRIIHTVLCTLLSARALLQPGILLKGFVLGLIAWACEGVGLMVLGNIPPEVGMDVSAAVGIYSIAVIVGALSFLPGGLGGTEALMVALLAAHGYTMPDAILLTLVCRLLTLWFAVLIGWIAVFMLRPQPDRRIKVPDDQPETLSIPLCVDLDGTLIHSDLLLETLVLLLKRNPLYVFLVPVWLLKGKAAMKAQIAARVSLNPAALPYNKALLGWLHSQRQAGRQLWLCTASNQRLADAVAAHLQIFNGVLASTDQLNLSGRKKAAKLVQQFGTKAFDYCGNAHIDLAIWAESRAAITVNAGAKLQQQAEKIAEIAGIFPKSNGLLRPILKAMRLHQWAKNVLIFVPLAAAHKLSDFISVQQTLMAFLAFGFCASSVYLLNDMLDLEVDREHPRKCRRPFASGSLSLAYGLVLIPLLLLATLLLALNLPGKFCLVLAGYYLLTIAYSFGLKRIVLIDTITLAGLYTVRIIAGATAIAVPLSFWLLLFSVFLFFSLALVKRYAELDAMQRQGKLKAAGRGYRIQDLPMLHSMGSSSGYLCVLVLALYINSPDIQALYHHPQVIWCLCVLLLYWISRIWLKTHRGEMHDDPVIFALKDKASLLVGALAALVAVLAV